MGPGKAHTGTNVYIEADVGWESVEVNYICLGDKAKTTRNLAKKQCRHSYVTAGRISASLMGIDINLHFTWLALISIDCWKITKL